MEVDYIVESWLRGVFDGEDREWTSTIGHEPLGSWLLTEAVIAVMAGAMKRTT